MRYYKLLTKLGYSKDDSVVGRIYPETLKIDLIYVKDLSNYYPNDWQEVTPVEYYAQEGKLPENYIVECNNAEESSAVLNSNTKGTRSWNFWKYCYTRSVDATGFGITKLLSYCPENYIMFSFEQWDQIVNKTMEEEFKLPAKWCTKIDNQEVVDYCNIHGLFPPYKIIKNENTYAHFPSWRDCTTCNRVKPGYTEITYEQFIKHVLNQEVMEDKEIIGWKLKEDCKKYEHAALNIVNNFNFHNFAEGYNFSTNSNNERILKQAGVLELWFTPVYKEKTLQFGGYDVIFEKVTSGVRITCNGETGTLSQIEAIYSIVLKKEKMTFGSQEVKQISYSDDTYWSSESLKAKPVSIKIGCTTGTWEEFTAIYEKAKSML